MNFKAFINESIEGMDIFFNYDTPAPALADWLEEHGFSETSILTLLRTTTITKEILKNLAELACKNPQLTDIHIGNIYNNPKRAKIIWETPISTRDWLKYELLCNPNIDPYDAPAGIQICKFSYSKSGASYGEISFYGNLQRIAKAFGNTFYSDEQPDFDEQAIINLGIVLWAYIVQSS